MSATNPYAPPATRVEDLTCSDPAAEALRREHIRHEATLRWMGNLYVIGGSLGASLGVLFFAIEYSGILTQRSFLGAAALYTSLSIPAVAIGWGLRKLQPWTRIAMVIFTGFGVFYIPSGTLINSYTLCLLFSPRSDSIFGAPYAALVAATPQVKARAPALVWMIVGLLLLGMVAWSMRAVIGVLWIQAVAGKG